MDFFAILFLMGVKMKNRKEGENVSRVTVRELSRVFFFFSHDSISPDAL